MSQEQEFSQAEYDYYWNLSQQEREQLLDSEQTSNSIRALLLFQQGEQLAAEKKFEAAIASYEHVLDIEPGYYKAWGQKGNALQLLSRYDDAIASYDKAVEVKPNYHWAWTERGRALAEMSRYQEAIASYDKALEIKPNYHWALRNRGDTLVSLNRYEEAISNYSEALEIEPKDHWIWANRGSVLAELNRYEEAIASYDKALEIKPDYHWAWMKRGRVLTELNRYEEALSDYGKAVEIEPEDHWTWTNRGNILAQLNRYDEAIANYDRALKIEPNNYRNWIERGDTLDKLKRHEEAVLSYDKASEQEANLKAYCTYKKYKIIKDSNKLLPYLTNRWAPGKRSFWKNLFLIYFTFQFPILFCTALALIIFSKDTFLAQVLQGGLSLIFTCLAILGIFAVFIEFRENVKTACMAYLKSGFLSYVRALLIIGITILASAVVYTYSPSFLRFGWGQLVFSHSGNWAITQPFEMANQAAETANTIQEDFIDQTPEIPNTSKAEASYFDFRWIFIPALWFLLIMVLPTWARWEEEIYRKGVHTWKDITINSIKFGLAHLIMGYPHMLGLNPLSTRVSFCLSVQVCLSTASKEIW